MTAVNRKIVLASRPEPDATLDNFRLEEGPVPTAAPGQVVARNLYLSLDPYMRGRMSAAKSYSAPVEIGGTMIGGAVARVESSTVPGFAPGDIVESMAFGWQDYAALAPQDLRKVDPDLAPISTALGILGMPGMTAYFGLLETARPKAGDTVVVSAASGAVGGTVSQLARIAGCRVVGIAGGADKCRYVTETLGADVCLDYRAEENLQAALAEACPNGIDVYFDNVGGEITDAVFQNLAMRARVIVCGTISHYAHGGAYSGPSLLRPILVSRAQVTGFLVFDWKHRYPEGAERIARWLKSGDLVYKEDVVDGLENAPEAFLGLLTGKNFGKLVVKVAD
ncbi:MAG: NADP-dependent oxidoreductase [Alphaproteobacteria bacterium]|nr:NADP-dependent oxidoreductase [Alphaproteobacteria bacterium]